MNTPLLLIAHLLVDEIIELLFVKVASRRLVALVVGPHGRRDVRVVGVAFVQQTLDLAGGQTLDQLVNVQLVERVGLGVAGRTHVDHATHGGAAAFDWGVCNEKSVKVFVCRQYIYFLLNNKGPNSSLKERSKYHKKMNAI